MTLADTMRYIYIYMLPNMLLQKDALDMTYQKL